MLMIRLQRIGKKKQPTYRLVVSEKTKDTQAGSLEILGHYDPLSKDKTLVLKEERIKYWLSVGAQASDTVYNLLLKAGLVSGDKKKSVYISNKRKAKKEEKAEAKEEKKEEPKVEEKPVEEKKEEVKAEPVEEKKEEKPAEEEKPKEEMKTE